MNVLIIDDEPSIAQMISVSLEPHGYRCSVAGTAISGLKMLREEPPDVVILDVGLPDMSGLELCRQIRTTVNSNPIVIFLTGHNSDVDHVAGWSIGGDDYIDKPFSPVELPHRIRAISSRSTRIGKSPSSAPRRDKKVLYFDLVEINPIRREVKLIENGIGRYTTPMTALEFEILYVLATDPQRVWKKTELLERVRNFDFVGDEGSICNYIKRIRDKLERREWIKAHPYIGYSFQLQPRISSVTR